MRFLTPCSRCRRPSEPPQIHLTLHGVLKGQRSLVPRQRLQGEHTETRPAGGPPRFAGDFDLGAPLNHAGRREGMPSLGEAPSGGARAFCLLLTGPAFRLHSKVSRRKGGTYTRHTRSNGYVHPKNRRWQVLRPLRAGAPARSSGSKLPRHGGGEPWTASAASQAQQPPHKKTPGR